MRWHLRCLLLPAALFICAFAQTSKPLTNDEIIQMVKAGFQEAVILKAVDANETSFDTSYDGLLALENVAVSQPIVKALPPSPVAKVRPCGSGNPVGLFGSGDASLACRSPHRVWRVTRNRTDLLARV